MVKGFSKLSKEEKIDWIIENYFDSEFENKELITQYWNSNEDLQNTHDEFIENTISNFYLPLGVAPNFLINEKEYTIPMAIEESSVVAAASNAAKFWAERGGFKATVVSTKKVGQVHFTFKGDSTTLTNFYNSVKNELLKSTDTITQNMKKRGGGIECIELINKTEDLEHYYQLHLNFNTLDAMGANFINSCLEQIAKTFKSLYISEYKNENDLEIIMCILSNYVPECRVVAEVSCPVEDLTHKKIEGKEFAEKFVTAVQIANIEPYRAVTHNKGVMNGIDAVVIATGNDFRAIEAGAHAYAAKDGKYSSLSKAEIKDGIFKFWLDIPLALGTVGGLTGLHPLVKFSMNLLQKPNAEELMKIIAVAGLAQNFAAVKSLVTTGIQEGHMKMHFNNILNQLNANKTEKEQLNKAFEGKTITHSAVVDALEKIRA